MKKTLLATAILGAMSFAAVAQAAPTVYGNIQLVVDLENDNTAKDNGSTIGFKGEEALDNGLTAIYKAEFEHNAGGEKAAGGLIKGDNAYLGVKGDFGTVKAGSFDTLANDFVYDVVAAPEFLDGAQSAFQGKSSEREIQQVAYVGNFGAAQVGASVQLNGKGNKVEIGKDANGNAVTAVDKDVDNAMQVAVKLPVDAFTVSAAYDTYKAAMGVAVSTSLEGIDVAGKFETSDAVDSELSLSASYNYGAGSVWALFSTQETAAKVETSVSYVGANYNLSKNMYVFAEVAGNDAKGSAIGATLVF